MQDSLCSCAGARTDASQLGPNPKTDDGRLRVVEFM